MKSVYETLAHIALTEFGDVITDHQLVYRRAATPPETTPLRP